MHRTIQDYDFSYEGFMESAEQSLPLGNGDVGANVWLDRTGTLHLLFSKTDSWTELNRLVKTGHFSLALSPNPFAEGARFTLCLADGMLRIQAEKASVSLYADANAPCVRLLAEADAPLAARLEVHNYRNRPLHFSYTNAYQYSAAEVADGLCESADRVFDVPGGVAVCHRNEGSCYRDMLRTQDMEGFAEDRPDPLDGRIFGVAAFAPGWPRGSMRWFPSLRRGRSPWRFIPAARRANRRQRGRKRFASSATGMEPTLASPSPRISRPGERIGSVAMCMFGAMRTRKR